MDKTRNKSNSSNLFFFLPPINIKSWSPIIRFILHNKQRAIVSSKKFMMVIF